MSEDKKKDILEKLTQAVIIGDTGMADGAARELLKEGIQPYDGIIHGLAEGMKIVGQKYKQKEYFLPEMLLSADAMYAGLNILTPHIKQKSKQRGKIVLGVVEGDIHDIGKNIVKTMLTAAGYEVIDLGKDVPASEFIKKAKEEGAQVIAMSTLMTPTLMSMKTIEDELQEHGMKGEVKTIVGGGPVTEDWRQKIGSDAFGKDALEAVDKIKTLVDSILAAAEAMEKE